jgi:hypothetical protein
MQTHTEISRESHNLFSAEEVAETIGADLKTVNEWLEVGAIDRAIFGVKFGLSPSCAKDVIREMEYDPQQVWGRMPSHFKAYAIIIPTSREWLVSWCWKSSTETIDPLPMEDHIILPVSDILARVTTETKQGREH